MYTLFHIFHTFQNDGKTRRCETVTQNDQPGPLEQAARQAIEKKHGLPAVLNGLHVQVSAKGPGFARFALTKKDITVCTSLAVWTTDGLRNAPPGFDSHTIPPSRLPVLLSWGDDEPDVQRALAWAFILP